MSVLDQYQAVKDAMDDFFAAVKTVMTKKPASSSIADDAQALGGAAAASYPAAAKNLADVHIANKNNPHNVTAATLGAYNKTESNALFAQKLPSGILPFSRFGTLDYLPIGVGGSYESGTTLGGTGYMSQPLVLERDGTLTWLRNATDGASIGAYYTYMKNALTAPLNAIYTNRRYHPAFVPDGKQVRVVYAGNKGVLLGEISDEGANTNRQMFVALCNGTLDDSKHIGALIPLSEINPTVSGGWRLAEPVLVGDRVYVLLALDGRQGNYPGSTPFEVQVVANIAVSDIIAGTITAANPVTGWDVTGVRSNKVAQTNIRLADMLSSENVADDAVFHHPASPYKTDFFSSSRNGLMTHTEVDAATGKLRTALFGLYRIYPDATSFANTEMMLSLVIDPVAKTAVVDAAYQGGCEITYNASKTSMILSNQAYSDSNRWISNSSYYYGGKNYLIAEDGTVLMVYPSNLSGGTYSIVRYKLANFTKPFDVTPANGLVSSTETKDTAAIGPSPFMSAFQAVSLLPNGYLTAISKGTGTLKRAVGKYKDNGESPTFMYKSLSGADIPGYSPKAYRKLSTDVGGHVNDGIFLTEIDQSGNITANRCTIFWDGNLSRPGSIDENQVVGSMVTVDATAFANAKAAAYTAAGYTGTPKATAGQLIVPVDAAAPCIFILWAIQPDGMQCAAVFTCSVNARTGTINSIGLVTLAGKYSSVVTTNTSMTLANSSQVAGSIYTKMAGGYAITLTGVGAIIRPGSGLLINSFKLFVNTDGSIEGFAYLEYDYDNTPAHYFALPGVGIGTLRNGDEDTDAYTKLEFQLNATDKASFITWPAKTRADKIVVMSQQVPAGWMVYFTDPTPVVMKGKYDQLAPASFDLTEVQADPSNSTFYVYVNWSGSTPAYQITTTEQAESDTRMYIGKIITGATQISTMQIDKVSRLGNYRISQTPVGMAIPATSGNPTQPATLAPGWKS